MGVWIGLAVASAMAATVTVQALLVRHWKRGR